MLIVELKEILIGISTAQGLQMVLQLIPIGAPTGKVCLSATLYRGRIPGRHYYDNIMQYHDQYNNTYYNYHLVTYINISITMPYHRHMPQITVSCMTVLPFAIRTSDVLLLILAAAGLIKHEHIHNLQSTLNCKIFATNNICVFCELTALTNFWSQIFLHIPKYR